jgi:DnaK suppressor protein
MEQLAEKLNLDDSFNDSEGYLSLEQLASFAEKLRQRRRELVGVSLMVKNDLKDTPIGAPDIYDVATNQSEINAELEGLKRHRGQITLIDRALSRINDGSYGYCEMTGEPIGIKRLTIHPTATLCVEAQEILERAERGSRFAQPAEWR